MDLRHLRYFAAVAEDLSFTAAARRLNVSQPPLSQQIRELEEERGTVLFERTSRHVRLTPAGAAFLVRVRAIFGQIEQAAEEARVIGQGRIGTLDIGMTGSVLMGPLASLVREFGAAFPQVVVRLHELPPVEQHAALLARRTQISFLRRPPEDPDLVTELAWPESVGVALPKDHRLTNADAIGLADLKGEDFAFLRLSDSPFAKYLFGCCVSAGFSPRIVQQAVESYSLISLVAAGTGVALVPEAIRRLVHPQVVYRPLRGTSAKADVMMLYRAERNAILDNFLAVARAVLTHAGPA